jgi:hypothetical protein
MVNKNSDQRASSCGFDPSYLDGVGVTHTLEVKRLEPLIALTGLRVLFTRIAEGFQTELSQEEWLFTLEAVLTLSKVRDRSFLAKHLVHLEGVSHAFKLIRSCFKRKLPIDSGDIRDALNRKNDPSVKERHRAVIPLCEYFGNFSEWSVKSYIKKTNLLTKKRHPPKRFVGVGYRDKGSRRIPSTDGRPAWQEVASEPVIYDNGRYLNTVDLEIQVKVVGTLNPLKNCS